MSVTIMEALQNADYNLQNNMGLGRFAIDLAKNQLHNAVELLDKGYALDDEVDPLLNKYGEIGHVPYK